ncbi:dockerin type I domain-containing protein, partial [Thermodesulfobacteriota bacterium]
SGNGIGNEKMDGLLARYYTIGTGLVLADDNPAIGSIVAKTNVGPGGSMLVWAEDVSTTGTIDKVWATIRPPDYMAGGILDPITDLPTIDLIDVGNGRYEASFNDFTTYGTYQVAVYAIDTNGNISSPQETSFCYVVCSDDYETDNAYAKANVIPLRTYQYHNFHNNGDEDWIKFYGIPEVTYVIMTAFQGTNCDPVIELFENDGQTLLAQKNTEGNPHAQESLYWQCAKEGIYYAKIRNYDPSIYGTNTEYRLEVWISMVSSNGIIEGTVIDAISGTPIAGATIKSFYQDSTAISLPETGSYLMVHPSGNAFLITQAWGYKTVGITIPVTTGEKVTKPIFMYPVSAFQDNYEEDDLVDQAKVIFLDNTSQHHSFHDRGDLDWVKLYGLAGKTYNLWTENSGFNCDIVIEIFRDDGVSSIVGPINAGGTGDAESIQWLCQEDGIYLIKLQQYDPLDYGDHTEYELKANIGVQNATSAIQGRVTYALNQRPIFNVIIIARDSLSNNAQQSALSDSNGNFRMLCSLGTYTLHAIVGDIEIAFDNVAVEQNIVTQRNISFPPVPGDVDGDMSINLLDAIIVLQVLSGLEFSDNANSVADVNDDGKIGIEDLTYIMQNMSGLR